jgi:hypothetical protein
VDTLASLLPGIIICAGIIAIGFEIRGFLYYKSQDCKLTQESIEKLVSHPEKDTKITNLSDREIKWFYKHIDGCYEGGKDKWTFIPKKEVKKEGNYYSVIEYPSVLRNSVPHSPVTFAPTALIASGVASTFLGISNGTAGADPNNLSKTGIVLFSSLQHVFLTSLLGLLFATTLIILIAVLTKQKEKYRNSLRKKLNEVSITITSEKLLSNINSSSTNNAAQELGNVAKSLNTLSAEAIGIAVAKAMATQNNALLTEIKTLREIQETQGQTVTVLVEQLEQKFIQPVVQRLEESAALTKDASQAVRELKNELGGISQSLAGAVTTIQSFQQQTLKDLQQFAKSLDTTLQNFQGETKGVLEQVGTEINRSVAQSILGMEAQRTAFEESATQAASTFRGIREDLQLALTTQATEQRAMLDAITSQTQTILQEANSAFQSQSTTLQRVGVEAANLMDTAKENLNSTLTNIDTTLQNTRQTVQDELENFRIEYQASLNTFFDLQNNLLKETLGKQQDGLAKVVASLQQTFHDEAEKRQQMSQEVDRSMDKILKTTQTVSNMANALGMTSSERLGQLQELSRTIGDEAHRVETAYQSMTNQFEQALEKGNKELSGYLSNANVSYSNYFKDFDFATAQVYKELNSTSGELLKAAQYLVVAADRQDNQEQN